MPNHIANRDEIIRVLKEELYGPSRNGTEIDISQIQPFQKAEEAYGPFREKGTGEEIIQRDDPTKHYGVGVLHPLGIIDEEKVDGQEGIGLGVNAEERLISGVIDDSTSDNLNKTIDNTLGNLVSVNNDTNPDDFDLSIANSYKPSIIGVSFLAEFHENSILKVNASGGRYREFPVVIAGAERKWWVRSEVKIYAEFHAKDILASKKVKLSPSLVETNNTEDLNLQIEVYSRPTSEQNNQRLMTVCLVNRTETDHKEFVLFQAFFTATITTPDATSCILPYPRPPFENLDEEERSIELLYRKSTTFAVGHGCAAGWNVSPKGNRANWISAECLPQFETPSMTPDITDENGHEIKVRMATLAGLVVDDDGFSTLEHVVASYEAWISTKQSEIGNLEAFYRETANQHLDNCKECAVRMRRGIQYLRSDAVARRAFMLANKAILLQQIHSRTEPRNSFFNEKSKRIDFVEKYEEPDPLKPGDKKGYWRAFQIAFLLMSIEPSINPNSPDRTTVELIWFPTGGGKTEAYLGLAAFALFMRRLIDPNDDGVHILMRYTLRLLTTQQFQRASRLICAMEYIRKYEANDLKGKPFSIGLWVGGDNTPNTRSEAKTVLRELVQGNKFTKNKFVLDRCPWCGAQIGPVEDIKTKKSKMAPKVIGYSQAGNTVVFRCPDNACEFKTGLPILVIDEDMYEQPPSMIIGTVDKFAMLTWRSDARALFGIGQNGDRVRTPPGLIIQDELHLISGPLGSMVGLYETIIEELCTDRRFTKLHVPKIISSTATIRRYKEQIQALYAREKVTLFPPPGIEEGDSFFGKYATDDQGKLLPGRKYVGVHAPALGSLQTVQVRTFTSLLQAPMILPEEERDPWWTLLLFFNSLRELGTTLTLLQSDIPDYQRVFLNRLPQQSRQRRSFEKILELTGRASSEDIPKAITSLEKRYPGHDPKPIDVCLASNILEVGIDIDRLSLMAVVGQPKTTSQYIQVTGRIGRSWWERPGLVITIYTASKPRDRSHFEKFRSYHERLYAQVEPTSVTPFSPPALERALHSVMVSYVMQTGNEDSARSPYPFPKDMIEKLKGILLPRVMAVDPLEVENFERVFKQKTLEWQKWEPIKWKAGFSDTDSDTPLLRVAGAYVTKEQEKISWATMQSMRSVDAECIAEIMNPALEEGDNDDAHES